MPSVLQKIRHEARVENEVIVEYSDVWFGAGTSLYFMSLFPPCPGTLTGKLKHPEP